MAREALYFGCLDQPGHYLHGKSRKVYHPAVEVPTLPWREGLMDGGLLKNGRHDDVVDGRVFWTCGGKHDFWFAFFWWDRSGDRRGASNSGLYVRGFEWPEIQEAFDFACAEWPAVVKRQRVPLVLQEPYPPKGFERRIEREPAGEGETES